MSNSFKDAITDTIEKVSDIAKSALGDAKRSVEDTSSDQPPVIDNPTSDTMDDSPMHDATAQPTEPGVDAVIDPDRPAAAGATFARPDLGDNADRDAIDVSTGKERTEVSGTGGKIDASETVDKITRR